MNIKTEALKRASLMLAAAGYLYRIELDGEVVANTLPESKKRDMSRFDPYKDEIRAVVESPEGTIGQINIKPELGITLNEIASNLAARCCQRLGKGALMVVSNKEENCVEWMRLSPKVTQ